MTYEAVVFDLDGTLLDTLADLADSLNQVLREKGHPTHPTEAFCHFVGNGAAKLVSRALPAEKRNDTMAADCLEAFRQVYSQHWNKKTQPYDGVPKLLDALTTNGMAMAVFTNKPQHFAELCVKEFLSRWEFAAIRGQQEGFPLKPDPAGAREIARSLGISTEVCLYLGDSDVDMQTAVNARMHPVGAKWGFRSEEELRMHGAIDVIDHPTDLLQILDLFY
ncbi:HAD family hydrolase [Planctomycetota bacterium]